MVGGDSVIAGLEPAIHLFAKGDGPAVKPAGDVGRRQRGVIEERHET
jgi:hypothetical protein